MENAMKHIHRTRGDRVFDAINVAALCLLLAVILYPLIYVLSCSFSDPLLVVQSKITFLPLKPTLVAYQRVFRNELIMTGYQNTLFYTLLGTVLNVAVTTMMAYPLSRHDFAARRPITMLTAFTMLFSGGMIPTFLVVKNLGLIAARTGQSVEYVHYEKLLSDQHSNRAVRSRQHRRRGQFSSSAKRGAAAVRPHRGRDGALLRRGSLEQLF